MKTCRLKWSGGIVPRAAIVVACLILSGSVPARAQTVLTANFDDLTEGSAGSRFTDVGITFSNLDSRLAGSPPPGNFIIEATTAVLPGFSYPNYLTFVGYVPGLNSGYSFGRFGSADIDFSGLAASASMNVFGFSSASANTLTLEGLLGGSVVASDTITFQSSNPGVIGLVLNVSGTFDRLQLVAAGPDNDGTDFFGLDNVQVTLVPEPGGVFLFFAAGAVMVAGRRVIRAGRQHPSRVAVPGVLMVIG